MNKSLEKEKVSLKANTQFFRLYRELHQPKGMEYTEGEMESPRHNYLKACDQRQLAPRRLKTGVKNLTNLELQDFSMGDQYADALSYYLKCADTIEFINLSSNRLSDKRIDLSNNLIGPIGIQSLQEPLQQFNDITELHLASNKLRDRGIQQLCTALEGKNTLRLLDVSKNAFSDVGANALAVLFSNSMCMIHDLSVSWNRIRSSGAVSLIDSLASNKCVRKIDFSWNGIGSGVDSTAATMSLCSLIKSSKVVHLDLTSNSFARDCMENLMEAMRNSNQLLALHSEELASSNERKDPSLFSKNMNIVMSSHDNHCSGAYTRIVGHSCVPEKGWTYSSNCWLCERWNVQKFTYTPYVSGPAGTRVSVACSFDKWKELELKLIKINNTVSHFELNILAPPGPFNFYFEVDGKKVYSNDSLTEKINDKETQQQLAGSNLHVINAGFVEAHPKVYDKSTGWAFEHAHGIMNTNAGNKLPPVHSNSSKIPKGQRWQLHGSIFARIESPTAEGWQSALRADWSQCQFESTMISSPTDMALVKDILSQSYSLLYQIYKNHAVVPDHSSRVILRTAEFKTLVKVCLIPDSADCSEHEIECLCVRLETKREFELPPYCIARYEWLELIVRLAWRKFILSKQVESLARAVQMLLDQHILKHCIYEKRNEFLKEQFFFENVEALIKANFEMLQILFHEYSEEYEFGNEKIQCVNLASYFKMIVEKNITHVCSMKDSALAYALSTAFVVDELESSRYEVLDLMQFIECLARLAYYQHQKAPPKNSKDQFVDYFQQFLHELEL